MTLENQITLAPPSPEKIVERENPADIHALQVVTNRVAGYWANMSLATPEWAYAIRTTANYSRLALWHLQVAAIARLTPTAEERVGLPERFNRIKWATQKTADSFKENFSYSTAKKLCRIDSLLREAGSNPIRDFPYLTEGYFYKYHDLTAKEYVGLLHEVQNDKLSGRAVSVEAMDERRKRIVAKKRRDSVIGPSERGNDKTVVAVGASGAQISVSNGQDNAAKIACGTAWSDFCKQLESGRGAVFEALASVGDVETPQAAERVLEVFEDTFGQSFVKFFDLLNDWHHQLETSQQAVDIA